VDTELPVSWPWIRAAIEIKKNHKFRAGLTPCEAMILAVDRCLMKAVLMPDSNWLFHSMLNLNNFTENHCFSGENLDNNDSIKGVRFPCPITI